MSLPYSWPLARTLAACALLGPAACGIRNPTAAPSPTPPPTTLAPGTVADLSASVTSPQAGHLLNCRNDVIAQVTLTNRVASGVAATGVRKTTRSVSGGCMAGTDFTYGIVPIGLGPGESAVVMDRPLYTGGSGCCTEAGACDGRFTCGIEQALTVLTTLGEVPAGTFTYDVNFLNCAACSATAAATGMRCPPPAH